MKPTTIAALAIALAACGPTTATTPPPAATTAPATPAGPATPAATCGTYNRVADFGNTPNKTARAAAITAATTNGQVIDFYSDQPITGTVSVDHVYSLAGAWPTFCTRPADDRRTFANDPANLVATTTGTNDAKGDKPPAQWASHLDQAHACAYGQRYQAVAAKYQLPVAATDADAITRACAG